MSRRSALALALVANVLWSGSYAAGKLAQQQISTIELNFLRFLMAVLLLAPAVLWSRRGQLRLSPRDWGLVVALGLTEVLNKFLQFYGLSLTTASETALLVASESIFIVLLAWLILRERLTGRSIAGLALGFAGVYAVVEGGLAPAHLSRGPTLLGDLLVLLAILVEAFYTIIGKDLLERRDPMLITTLALVVNFAFWIPAATWDVLTHGIPVPSAATWAAVLYLAVVATVVAYSLWFLLLEKVSASVVAPTLFIQPLLGALIGALALGERPALSTVIGGLVILAGVYVTLSSKPDWPTIPTVTALIEEA